MASLMGIVTSKAPYLFNSALFGKLPHWWRSHDQKSETVSSSSCFLIFNQTDVWQCHQDHDKVAKISFGFCFETFSYGALNHTCAILSLQVTIASWPPVEVLLETRSGCTYTTQVHKLANYMTGTAANKMLEEAKWGNQLSWAIRASLVVTDHLQR